MVVRKLRSVDRSLVDDQLDVGMSVEKTGRPLGIDRRGPGAQDHSSLSRSESEYSHPARLPDRRHPHGDGVGGNAVNAAKYPRSILAGDLRQCNMARA